MKKFALHFLLLLILFTGCGANNSFMEFSYQSVRTNGGRPDMSYPSVFLISSFDELYSYYTDNKDYYDLERRKEETNGSIIGFLDVCDEYSASYFEENNLLLACVRDPSGSIEHQVTNIECDKDGIWNIDIKSIPLGATTDMATWHIFIQIDKNITSDDSLKVNYS